MFFRKCSTWNNLMVLWGAWGKSPKYQSAVASKVGLRLSRTVVTADVPLYVA